MPEARATWHRHLPFRRLSLALIPACACRLVAGETTTSQEILPATLTTTAGSVEPLRPSPQNVAYSLGKSYSHSSDCLTSGIALNGSDSHVLELCNGVVVSTWSPLPKVLAKVHLRHYDLATGELLLERAVPEFSEEGLALVGDRLFTSLRGEIVEYDVRSFLEVRRHRFPFGESFQALGLATDGYDLYATNGSAVIYQLRPGDTSELTLMRTILVQSRGRTFPLGALVYAHPVLWVSVWQTKRLIRVNLDGEIEAWLEMDDAHSFGDIRDAPSAIAQSAFVGPDVLLVTGRSWPSVLSLTLSAGALCGRETCEAPASPSPTPVTMPPTLPRTPPPTPSRAWPTPSPTSVDDPADDEVADDLVVVLVLCLLVGMVCAVICGLRGPGSAARRASVELTGMLVASGVASRGGASVPTDDTVAMMDAE